jgi:hypothetical protein
VLCWIIASNSALEASIRRHLPARSLEARHARHWRGEHSFFVFTHYVGSLLRIEYLRHLFGDVVYLPANCKHATLNIGEVSVFILS